MTWLAVVADQSTETVKDHLIVAVLTVVGGGIYYLSLLIHPFTTCSKCKDRGRRRRSCRACKGTGQRPRLGARLLIMRKG